MASPHVHILFVPCFSFSFHFITNLLPQVAPPQRCACNQLPTDTVHSRAPTAEHTLVLTAGPMLLNQHPNPLLKWSGCDQPLISSAPARALSFIWAHPRGVDSRNRLPAMWHGCFRISSHQKASAEATGPAAPFIGSRAVMVSKVDSQQAWYQGMHHYQEQREQQHRHGPGHSDWTGSPPQQALHLIISGLVCQRVLW